MLSAMPDTHRGHDEDDRHERRHPEGIGLDRSEDETGIAVQETRQRVMPTSKRILMAFSSAWALRR